MKPLYEGLLAVFAAALLAGGADAQDHDGPRHVREAGGDTPDRHRGAHSEEEHRDDVVHLTPEEIAELEIEIATAGPGTVEVYVELPGEVQPNSDRLAHIVPRYSGIVVEVRANIGDRVGRGDVLAVVESDDALAPYPVKTLIDGTVIAKHITLGEAVSRDKDTFLIADLSTVWVDLAVYQRDIDRIRRGERVQIFTGHGPALASGTISYVTPVIDESTRTATARVVLPNDSGLWRPGMFVTARVLVEEREAEVAVPRSAVHTMDERPVVFHHTSKGFAPRSVELGAEGLEHIEVLSGLDPGDRYAVSGGFTLKAELERGSFGDGHSH